MCIIKQQQGISLVELIVCVVIMGIALAGLLSVMNLNTVYSVDPLVRQQAFVIAESLLEEIEAQDFLNAGCAEGCQGEVTQRSRFDDVFDYQGIQSTADVLTGIAALSRYTVNISVVHPVTAWGDIPPAEVAQITVTVSEAAQTFQVVGYRMHY
jgi:MSHA pilin protein MshD